MSEVSPAFAYFMSKQSDRELFAGVSDEALMQMSARMSAELQRRYQEAKRKQAEDAARLRAEYESSNDGAPK